MRGLGTLGTKQRLRTPDQVRLFCLIPALALALSLVDRGARTDTRWSLVGQALFDPTLGVVKTFETRVRFGVDFFTGHPGRDTLKSRGKQLSVRIACD